MSKLSLRSGFTVLCLVAAYMSPGAGVAGQSPDAGAPADTAWFYKGLDYGSQRTFSPLSAVANTGMDVFQFVNHDIRFVHYPWGSSIRRLGVSLKNPFKTVADQGWGRFLKAEILPGRFTTHDASWIPNYSLHLIGLGQTYAALDEWYGAHGFPASRPLAAVTALGAGLLNEAAESNGGKLPPSPAMVADVYIFNLGGVLLFSSEGVRRFFATKLMLTDWSSLPMFMSDGTVQNTGQFWAVKVPLPKLEHTRFFTRFGLAAMLGLSHLGDDGSAWSWGVGPTGVRHYIRPLTGIEDIDLDWTAGVFYDRDNSLMASLIWALNTRQWLSVNLYPGLLPGVAKDVGVWVGFDAEGRPRMGLTMGKVGGLGYGHAW